MPTYGWVERFLRDFRKLTQDQQGQFKVAVGHFIEDLNAGRAPRAGLRVKRVRGAAGVWEMTWAPDGRATFEYGNELRPGEAHIIWRRIGTHDVFIKP